MHIEKYFNKFNKYQQGQFWANLGPILAKFGQTQISWYVIKHLFKVFIMLWLLLKKSGKDIEHFRRSIKKVRFPPILGMFRSVTPEPELLWTCGFHRKIQYHKIFHLNIIWIPSPLLDFQQNWKNCQKWHFLPLFPTFRENQIFFPKIRLCHFSCFINP